MDSRRGPEKSLQLLCRSDETTAVADCAGNQMVFFILGTVVVADIILTYEPFLPKSVDKPKHDDSEFVATAAVASSQK